LWFALCGNRQICNADQAVAATWKPSQRAERINPLIHGGSFAGYFRRRRTHPVCEIVHVDHADLPGRDLSINGVASLLFGYLCWKRGLEAAMLAHFSTDIMLHVVGPMFFRA
jgi:hypothetical protein